MLEKTLESPMDIARRSNQSVSKGNQSAIFNVKIDAEAGAPILWPPDAKRWHSLEKTLMLGKRAGGEGDNRG